MKNAYTNFLKAGLALITGWLGAGLLLLTLLVISQTALADSYLCKVDRKATVEVNTERRGLVRIPDDSDYIVSPAWEVNEADLLNQEKWTLEILKENGPQKLGGCISYNNSHFVTNCESFNMPFTFNMDLAAQKFSMTRMIKRGLSDEVVVYAEGGSCSRI